MGGVDQGQHCAGVSVAGGSQCAGFQLGSDYSTIRSNSIRFLRSNFLVAETRRLLDITMTPWTGIANLEILRGFSTYSGIIDPMKVNTIYLMT